MARKAEPKQKNSAAPKRRSRPNCILAYYQQIQDGTVTVGRWIALLYEKLVGMIEAKELIYDAKRAYDAIDYIETRCFHTEGVLAPGLLKLELWQKAFLSCVFGLLDPETKLRAFREIVLLIGRKNGKSALAAAIGKYEFEKDGGFGARIYCIAPKLDQAEIIYNNLWQMFLLDEEQKRLDKDDPFKARHRMTDLFMPGTNSTVKKIAFSARKSDGFNPSLTICDEIASWQGANGLKQYEVMKSGMGARPEGLMLSCTTAGYDTTDGIYDELLKRSTRYLLGDSQERRLLPFLYMIDDVSKWNDVNELAKSNPNLSTSIPVSYLLDEVAIAEGSLSKKNEFLCKYCNIKASSSSAWLAATDVERMCGDPLKIEDFDNCYCLIGIDLSQTTDLTAACFLIERGGELYVFCRFFMPAGRIDDAIQRDGVPYNIYVQRGLLQPSGESYVDYHDVFDYIMQMIQDYHLYPLECGYDRYSAQYLIADLKAAGVAVDDVYQGENLWPVIQEAAGLIEDGRIHIGDNDLLKMHLLNCAVKMSVERGRGKLVKLKPTLHIDGAAALIDALTVRQKWWGEIGAMLTNEG